MYARIEDVINDLCPVKMYQFAKDRPYWLTDDLNILMKERDWLLKKFSLKNRK